MKIRITKAQNDILLLLQDKPQALYAVAGFNKHPAIRALERRGFIEVLFENGHHTIYSLTDKGTQLLVADKNIIRNGRRTYLKLYSSE